MERGTRHFYTCGDLDGYRVYRVTGTMELKSSLKLQALVYDILPPTTAIIDYAIDLKQKQTNCQLTSSFSMVLKRQ